ncbi:MULTISPECIES: hypothetical protein [Streptomyces]|nr:MULTISPECIES: hypothetical protein [Streptomyces]WFB88551.1 hypothetical protein MMU79_37595 [Streptomyces olivaceus]WGK50692.1 hypothetical protein M6G09_36620 [Streptomyces sp. B146]
MESFGELLFTATVLRKRCLQIDSDELAFHLVEVPAASCQGPLTDLAPG